MLALSRRSRTTTAGTVALSLLNGWIVAVVIGGPVGVGAPRAETLVVGVATALATGWLVVRTPVRKRFATLRFVSLLSLPLVGVMGAMYASPEVSHTVTATSELGWLLASGSFGWPTALIGWVAGAVILTGLVRLPPRPAIRLRRAAPLRVVPLGLAWVVALIVARGASRSGRRRRARASRPMAGGRARGDWGGAGWHRGVSGGVLLGRDDGRSGALLVDRRQH